MYTIVIGVATRHFAVLHVCCARVFTGQGWTQSSGTVSEFIECQIAGSYTESRVVHDQGCGTSDLSDSQKRHVRVALLA